MSLLISGTSSKAPATQTASSEAARIASSSAISVVPTRSLEGRVFLALRAVARRASRPAYRLLSSLGVPFATSAVSATLCDNMRGSSSNCSPIGNPTRLFLDSGGVPACSLSTTRECHAQNASAVAAGYYRRTSNASMPVAPPPSAAMSAASRRTAPSATSKGAGSSVRKRLTMISVRTPITDSRGPVMPTSVM